MSEFERIDQQTIAADRALFDKGRAMFAPTSESVPVLSTWPHVKSPMGGSWCNHDGEPWPCPSQAALNDERERAEALETALRSVSWNEKGGPCWCRESPELTGEHEGRCSAARAALTSEAHRG